MFEPSPYFGFKVKFNLAQELKEDNRKLFFNISITFIITQVYNKNAVGMLSMYLGVLKSKKFLNVRLFCKNATFYYKKGFFGLIQVRHK